MKRKLYNLELKAKIANGKDRMCWKCNHFPCPDAMFNVCSEAFERGFKKGYNKSKEEQKQKISSMLHDASENIKDKNLFIFFRDVRGDEDAAFIERTRFVKPAKEQSIGTVKWEPKEKNTPQQLPIAWINEDDLLNLLGYKRRFKELEAISLNEGCFAYPREEYQANLEKYKDIRAKFSKHK